MITSEQWHRVKAIFHSAVEWAPAERASLLKEACGGDEFLRAEVVSLMAADENNENFLEASAYELLAGTLAPEESAVSAGQNIGPYTILSSLGRGGMGEVYLAHDHRLGRKIALKLLSPEFARDEQRVLRFAMEARAASALNHPNVCVIHEVGQSADGRHFMAMEHIEGITVRRRMMPNRMTLKEALDVAAQVAWALAAAHAVGIVHRDIKPENIMLRDDGYVKILDFGIAKLSARSQSIRNLHEASTVAQFHTAPGTVIGTVQYMSPEQLRELSVDERTDIWSLGVVLHEMVTGFTPFEAPTKNETIASILSKQPAKLLFDSREVSEEFQRVVRKALSKKRDERYQTIKEFAADLGQLRRHTPELSALPTLSLESQNESPAPENERSWIGSRILESVKLHAGSTVEYVFSEIKEHPKAAIFTGALVIAVLFGVKIIPPNPAPPLPGHAPLFQTVKMTPLTNSGKSVRAAISPDGKSVAHAELKDGMQELLMTSVVTLGSSVVVPPTNATYLGLAFSPDGDYLYFTRADQSEVGALYQVALPGGVARRIKDGVDSPVSFSPNGDRFSFVRFNRANSEYFLMIAGVDGTGERVIATRKDGNTLSVYGPAWSVDGTIIVCSAGHWSNGYHENLTAVNVEDGKETPIGSDQWYLIGQVAWLPDQSGLVISGEDLPIKPYQLWRVSYPRGDSTAITNDTTQYEDVSLSRDGKRLVSIHGQQVAQIWVAPEGDLLQGKAIAGIVGPAYGLSWTSKGKIVYSSMTGNHLNLVLIDADGSNPTPLTVNAGDNYTPTISADGRFVVFASNRTGGLNLWRINAADGSEPKQLTFTDGNAYPSVSPDGQWIVYDNQSQARTTVWKVSIDGGVPVQLSREYARLPVVSPDGAFIALRHMSEAGVREIAIVPFQGGQPVKRVPIRIMDWQTVRWTRDGRALTYIDTKNGVANIWSYDLASGSTRQLTDFKADQIYAYAWSPDHKQLSCERGSAAPDVMIIDSQP